MGHAISAVQLANMLGDWQGTESAYIELSKMIQLLILDGRLPAEVRVPSERNLAPVLDVSRNTVTAAYRLLREQGSLRSQRGAGSFVAVPATIRPVRSSSWLPARVDRSVIDLSVASVPAPVALLRQAVDDAGADLHDHADEAGYDLHGILPLRQAVADRYSAAGLPTSPEHIMITAGAHHAWMLLVRLLSRERSPLMVESPTYPKIVDSIKGISRRAVFVSLDADGWNPEQIEATIRSQRPALAYFMPDFHNPTGLVMPAATRQQIVAVAHEVGTHVVFDETLSDLAIDENGVGRDAWGGHRSDDAIFLGSLSKTCWAGLRVGWLRAAPSIVARLVRMRAATDICNSVLLQLVAVHVLASYDAILQERRESLGRNRGILVEALRTTIPEWSFVQPPGGLSLWIDLGARVSSRLALAAADAGVLVLSGSRFGMDGTLENHLRLPFIHDEAAVTEGVTRLAAAFRRLT